MRSRFSRWQPWLRSPVARQRSATRRSATGRIPLRARPRPIARRDRSWIRGMCVATAACTSACSRARTSIGARGQWPPSARLPRVRPCRRRLRRARARRSLAASITGAPAAASH